MSKTPLSSASAQEATSDSQTHESHPALKPLKLKTRFPLRLAPSHNTSDQRLPNDTHISSLSALSLTMRNSTYHVACDVQREIPIWGTHREYEALLLPLNFWCLGRVMTPSKWHENVGILGGVWVVRGFGAAYFAFSLSNILSNTLSNKPTH